MTYRVLAITDRTNDDMTDRITNAIKSVNRTDRSEINIPVTDDVVNQIIDLRTNDDGTHGVSHLFDQNEDVEIVILDGVGPRPVQDALADNIDVAVSPTDLPGDDGDNTHRSRIEDTLITEHNAWVVTPTRITIPRGNADQIIDDAMKWRSDDDDSRSIDDLPSSTKWIDGHPAPAVGKEHEGRPPIGYIVTHGELHPHPDEYPVVRNALVAADDARVSISRVARKIDASETTVKRIIHDPERRRKYGLDVRVDAECPLDRSC